MWGVWGVTLFEYVKYVKCVTDPKPCVFSHWLSIAIAVGMVATYQKWRREGGEVLCWFGVRYALGMKCADNWCFFYLVVFC